MKEKITLVSGGFDPLHRGHIKYFKEAKKLSKYLVVAINSDEWLVKKKKFLFMDWKERSAIVKNLSVVDEVISFNDSDNSACDAIEKCLKISKIIIFANGGDRNTDNCLELNNYKDHSGVECVFGVGGVNKLNSSSWLTSDFIKRYLSVLEEEKTIQAPWGSHSVFIDDSGFKVKQIDVLPGSQLSLQKHQHRSEHWVVVRGQASVEVDDKSFLVEEGGYAHIPLQSVHRLSNNTLEELILIEVQCGEILEESDIVRLEDSYGRV